MKRDALIRKVCPLRCGARSGNVRSRTRGGFTLLEVLTSIFVLTFGLLGITAMMQIGGYRVWQATRREKAAFIAEQAFADVQIRETIPTLDDFCKAMELDGTFQDRSLVVYDPEGAYHVTNISGAGTDGDAGRFGWLCNGNTGGGSQPPSYLPSYFSSYKDLAWSDLTGEALQNHLKFAGPVMMRSNRCQDDLVWNTSNPERRPIAQWWNSDGSMVPRIDAYGNEYEDLWVQAYEGNWSWLATIQPVDGRTMNDGISYWNTNTYEVSVAVYETRSFHNEVGFSIVSSNAQALLDSMVRGQFTIERLASYSDVEPSRTLLQPGHWVALVGKPMDACDEFGNLPAGHVNLPLEQRVVWMQVTNSESTANGYRVQLTGPDLARMSTVRGPDETVVVENRPLLISPNFPIYLITDPEIVGVVTRTISIAR